MGNLDCEAVRELLPWFVRGTLATEEREAVAAHLEDCAACRAELAETRRALWIASRHLPAELLADYGAGFPIGDWPRELVEGHLADCADCRADLGLDEATAPAFAETPPPDPLPFRPTAPMRQPASTSALRPLALAASLVAAVALGWFGRALDNPGGSGDSSGAARVALVELEPESLRTRGGEDAAPILDRTGATTLLLHSDLVPDGGELRLRVVAADGKLLEELSGVTRSASGAFVVLLRPQRWPAGAIRLELEARSGGGWQPFESYRIEVAPPSK